MLPVYIEKLRAREWQAHRPGPSLNSYLLAVRGGKEGKEKAGKKNANEQVVEHLEH